MARITIEDCAKIVPNRFELVVLAVQRTLAIISGSKPLVKADNKEPILALREIASNQLDIDELRNAIINKYRKNSIISAESIDLKNIPSFFSSDDDFGLPEDRTTKSSLADLDLDITAFSEQNIEVDD